MFDFSRVKRKFRKILIFTRIVMCGIILNVCITGGPLSVEMNAGKNVLEGRRSTNGFN
jgi:hypothetical protein